MNSFLTPEELWNGFDMSGELEVEVLQTDQFGEYVYEQVLFSGHHFPDGTCKIFGVFAYGRNSKKPTPCVVLVHDKGGRIDYSYIDYFLNLGVSVFMCDYYGVREGERHSIFPPTREAMNYQHNTQSDITRGVENSVWIDHTNIFRHAIKFLRAQEIVDSSKIGVCAFGLGSIIGFHLAFCEPQLAFSINFHYGGWRDFDEISKELNFEKAKYILSVAPQAYSSIAKVPLFVLGSTNTRVGDTDRIFDTFARCNGEINNFLYLSPNYISTVDHLATRNLRLLINQYLFNAHVDQPSPPEISCTIQDDRLLVSCNADDGFDVNSVKLYFSQGDNPPHLRAYKFVELAPVSRHSFVASIEVSSSLPTVMIANAEFKNGYTLTSNQLKVPAFGNSMHKHNIITLGKRESFFPLGTLNYPNANQFFRERTSVEVFEGVYGILGISSPRIASFAMCDPCLEKTGKTIMLQLYSDLPQKIRLLLSVSDNHEANYSSTINLVGGELWQKILLDPSDFIDAELRPLSSFENCKLLFFTSEYDFSISNMTMV